MNEAKSSVEPDLFRINLIIQTNKGLGILRLFFWINLSFIVRVRSSLVDHDSSLESSMDQTHSALISKPTIMPAYMG